MSKLINAMQEVGNVAQTENLAASYASTLNPSLDWFGKVGALRGQESKAIDLFDKAFAFDPNAALRILFYGRDVRGGQGERSVFRAVIRHMAINHTESIAKNIHLIPEYGRWDDLYSFVGTPLEERALSIIGNQLIFDRQNIDGAISLAGKWAKSVNASSKESRRLGKLTAESMGATEREYRKLLSTLRARLNVIERLVCAGEWDKISYQGVPSQAAKKYSKAFLKHDENRYREYLEKVSSGEAKINASTLYPYQLIEPYLDNYSAKRPENDSTLNALWNSLPNYLEGNEHKGLVLADVSGSMYSGCGKVAPIAVSISLAMYIAERNTGLFKDAFLTFTSSPKLEKIIGNGLYDRIASLASANWGMSTNLQAAIELILESAKKHSVPADEMPEVLYIVSDMQFNCCGSSTNWDVMKEKYEESGYALPKVVFWNVNSYSDAPITQHDKNTALVSGCSPVIFSAVLSGSGPVEIMNNLINSDRYSPIKA